MKNSNTYNLNKKDAYLSTLIITPFLTLISAIYLSSKPPYLQHSSNLLLDLDFSFPLSKYELQLISHQHVSLEKNAGADGSNAIRVTYKGSRKGSERVIKKIPLKLKTTHAQLSFDVKFSNDFQWRLGGKLHGLSSVKPISGGESKEADSWSARLLFAPKGKAETYIYDQNLNTTWGSGISSNSTVFMRGKWHKITLEIKIDEENGKRGSFIVFVDGKEIISQKDINFRKVFSPKSDISMFLFSTFHGGNSDKYSPKDAYGNLTTVYAWFDNFHITCLEDIPPTR